MLAALDDTPDAALLTAFAAGDADAFAALVRRHGPMVLGVCRRTVGDVHLADDAFQATFLVLARKAKSVTHAGVGGWLFRTATHVAVRARTARDRRRKRETLVDTLPDRPAPSATVDTEAVALLGEEVGRLPARLREAVLACELAGVSRAVAARRLGIPEGTLSSRLAAARARLAERLGERGVAPLAALAVAVPATLLAAEPSAVARSLASEVCHAMLLSKWPVAVLLGVTVAAVTGLTVAAPPADPPPPVVAKPAAVAPADRLVVNAGGELRFYEGDTVRNLGKLQFMHATLAPGGKRMTVMELVDANQSRDKEPVFHTVIRPEAGPPHVIPKMHPAGTEFPAAVTWSADGKTLLVRQPMGPAGVDGRVEKLTHWRYDPATGTKTEVPAPAGHYVIDWSADGKTLLTYHREDLADGRVWVRLALVPTAGGKPDWLFPAERHLYAGKFSPDGTKLLLVGHEPDQAKTYSGPQLYVLTLADRRLTRLTDPTDFWMTQAGVAWSPDGKRVAYSRKKLFGGKGDDAAANAALVVCDADGKNPRTLAARTLTGEPGVHTAGFWVCDWR